MLYKERLQRLVESGDPFFIDAIDHFIRTTYEKKEEGISDLEELAKNRTRFNAFTREIIQRKDDLKSVKTKFFVDTNIISEKIVEKIHKLDDNAVSSIRKLLDEDEYDSETMFDIFDITVEKLEKVGLYLDFGQHENRVAGLPWNISFKKGYIKRIIISERFHNGTCSKGSIFSEIFDFTLKGNKAVIKTYLEFCIDEKRVDVATLESSIPFTMSEEEILKIEKILNRIKSKYPVYTSKKETFNPDYLKYTDISINDVNYSIKSDDEILSKIRELIRYDFSAQSISFAYDYLIK